MTRKPAILHWIGPFAAVATCLCPPLAAHGAEEQTVASTTSGKWDWYQYRGPDRNGISNETGWQTSFPGGAAIQLWKAKVGTGFATVSVAGGRLYTMGSDGKMDSIYCLNALTGERIWKYEYPCDLHAIQHEGGPCATPAIDGDRVYTFSKQGDLHCLDAADGKVIWKLNVKQEFGVRVPRWGLSGSPLIDGKKLILDGGWVIALDKSDGKLIWKSKDDLGAGYSSPIKMDVDGKPCYVIFNGYGLLIVTADEGKEICRLEWDTNYDVNAATPLVNGNEVFISSGYNKGCALVKIEGGKPNVVWQNKNMRNHFNSSVLWKDHLYGFDDIEVKCLSYKDGEVKWSERGLGKGSLMLADGKLIILSERGELVIAEADPAGFKEISRSHVLGGKCWTVPVLSNGLIYCRNAAGDLVCVDVRGK